MGWSTKLRTHTIANKPSELQWSWSGPWDFKATTQNPLAGQGKPIQGSPQNGWRKPTTWVAKGPTKETRGPMKGQWYLATEQAHEAASESSSAR